MTIVSSTNSAITRYYQLRDRHIASGGVVPQAVYRLALDGRYEDAITWLRSIDGGTITWGVPGRFADEVRPLTAEAQAEMRARALANIAAEVRGAGAEELDHFARMGEAQCRTDLGRRIQDLVEDEHTRQMLTVALMPMPPADGQPQAGPRRPDGLPQRTPLLFDAVVARFPQEQRHDLGLQVWAIREERWEQAGRVGAPDDAEYDDFFYQGRTGEGGS